MMNDKLKKVPVLITWDADPHSAISLENEQISYDLVLKMLKDVGVVSTIYFPGEVAKRLSQKVKALDVEGHEIACHGLTHGDEEEYDVMPENMLRSYLSKAKSIIEGIINKPITSFRAPRVKTSALTQKVLEEVGFESDFSVNSQRMDVVSSNLINIGWLFAPRLPYHPSTKNPYKRGDRKLWVVPNSAILLPFISTATKVFGLSFMKWMFRLLYRESLRNNKPIVYIIHPYELVDHTIQVDRPPFSLKTIKTHGFVFRDWFYEKDAKKLYNLNKELFAYMKSFGEVEFVTASDYLNRWVKK